MRVLTGINSAIKLVFICEEIRYVHVYTNILDAVFTSGECKMPGFV